MRALTNAIMIAAQIDSRRIALVSMCVPEDSALGVGRDGPDVAGLEPSETLTERSTLSPLWSAAGPFFFFASFFPFYLFKINWKNVRSAGEWLPTTNP